MGVLIAPEVDRLMAISNVRSALRSGRLRQLREAHGLSQRELAQALDVDESTLSKWESGVRVPRQEAAQRLYFVLRAFEQTSESATPAVAGEVAPRNITYDETSYHDDTPG